MAEIRLTSILCVLILFLYCNFVRAQSSEIAEIDLNSQQELKQDFEKELSEGLLKLWYPKAIDEEKGGFFSSFTYDWQLGENQNKMIVTQARHVWTNAKASGFFPENKTYSKAAAHGILFLKDKMWDKKHGGFYDLVTRNGKPISNAGYSQYKRTYGNAFGIYALAAYYQISKDDAALDLAKETFLWLEQHAHDSIHGGYFPSLTREGKIVLEAPKEDIFDNIGQLNKDQNTSIHLLEAFTELYKVWPDQLVAIRLKEMLQIIRDSIVTEPGYLHLYFYRDWTPVSLKDSSEVILKNNFLLDHVSFGHDIETAFLMLEAAQALGKFEWDKTLKTAKMLVDHTMANGFDKDVGGIYEQGYYFNDSASITIVDERKNWWAQAEALNSLLLFSKLYPEEKSYKKQFLKQWDYVQKYLIDDVHGGWYNYGLDTAPETKYEMKGHIWKATYHDGRALMNIVRMLNGEDILSEH